MAKTKKNKKQSKEAAVNPDSLSDTDAQPQPQATPPADSKILKLPEELVI